MTAFPLISQRSSVFLHPFHRPADTHDGQISWAWYAPVSEHEPIELWKCSCTGRTSPCRPRSDAVLLGPSGVIGTYRKVHVLAGENHVSRAGRGFPVFDTLLGRIGMQICYDKCSPRHRAFTRCGAPWPCRLPIRDRFSGGQRAMSASIDHAPAPSTISATAAPSARRWYSTPSPSCVPSQFIKKPYRL
jgi:hypothetical protein